MARADASQGARPLTENDAPFGMEVKVVDDEGGRMSTPLKDALRRLRDTLTETGEGRWS